MRREARRKVGPFVDTVYGLLEHLSDKAEDAEDEQALAYCEEAFDAIDDTLTPGGLPTVTTAERLPEIVAGPIARAVQRLHPGAPLSARAGERAQEARRFSPLTAGAVRRR
jgi:hypothetical protein